MKRHPYLVPLSDDHHGALVLARRIGVVATQEPGALRAVWADLRQRFARELDPHFRVEEEWLLLPLEAVGEETLAERIWGDHARLEALAWGAPDATAAAQFAELLHGHVRFEERELFPCAERLLPLPVLEAAGREALQAREVRTRAAAADAATGPAAHADPEPSPEAPGATEKLREAALHLARHLTTEATPAARSAVVEAGALAADLLASIAALSARRGPMDSRERARAIARRGGALRSALGSAAHVGAEAAARSLGADGPSVPPERIASDRETLYAATDPALDLATRCAQVAALAAEVAHGGPAAMRPDAEAALRLAVRATECALAIGEASLGAASRSDRAREVQRQVTGVHLLLRRARSTVDPR